MGEGKGRRSVYLSRLRGKRAGPRQQSKAHARTHASYTTTTVDSAEGLWVFLVEAACGVPHHELATLRLSLHERLFVFPDSCYFPLRPAVYTAVHPPTNDDTSTAI